MSGYNLVIAGLRDIESDLNEQLRQVRETINFAMQKSSNGNAPSIAPKEMKAAAKPRAPKGEKPKRKYNLVNRNTGNGEAIDPVAEIIRKAGRFVHIAEVPEFKQFHNVSSILSVAKTKGKRNITNYKPGASNNQTTWGFTEWVGADGKPKPEYMFNEDFVLARK